MLIENRQVIDAPRPELWDFLQQLEQVGECIPGVEGVRPVGPEQYEATMKVKVGSINLKFDAQLNVLERDREHWTAKMHAQGTERGVGGGAKATFTMTLAETEGGATELLMRTDARVLGKLAEFGQPVMQKKAEKITEQFARTIGDRLVHGKVPAGLEQRVPAAAAPVSDPAPSLSERALPSVAPARKAPELSLVLAAGGLLVAVAVLLRLGRSRRRARR
jgi:carbon monoxide dehydrogenase subunit G